MIGVDEPDDVAIGDDAVVFRVDSDRALEWPVHGVVTQQARTLQQVAVAMLSHYHRAQPKLSAATGLLHQ